ncbi:ester cyclase [Kribbella sp. NPDC005582]|uniref:ester cyclase n=1 Tax=Kribbella sp. NPDC005582 TaxID=3156893 RepID=UPI0033AB712F
MAIDRRSLIKNSGAVGFGALALAAVNSGTALADSAYPAHLSPTERRHLRIFDELDFEIFSGQKWDRLDESHARNIRVHWPDGHFTDGIDKHIADLKAMFVWAPDTRIHEHPLRLATNELTAVTGIMEGTFTRPMPDGKGGYIQPTNKPYRITMATVGIWNRHNTMDEEYLFWDNQSFNAQIGLG